MAVWWFLAIPLPHGYQDEWFRPRLGGDMLVVRLSPFFMRRQGNMMLEKLDRSANPWVCADCERTVLRFEKIGNSRRGRWVCDNPTCGFEGKPVCWTPAGLGGRKEDSIHPSK